MKEGVNIDARGVIYAITAAFCWGVLPIFARRLFAAGLDAVSVAAYRAVIAAIFVFVYALFFRRSALRVKWRDLPFFMVYGAICVPGMYICYLGALSRVSASVASILLYTAPAFVVILARVFLGEKITRVKLIALLCVVSGCALALGAAMPQSIGLDPYGVMLGLGAGLSYALLTILGSRGLSRYQSYTNMAYMLGFGALIMMAIRPISEMPSLKDPLDIAALIALSIVSTVLANLFYVSSIRRLGAGTASLTVSLDPVITTALSAAVLGEGLHFTQAIGVAIVVAGICLPILAFRIRANQPLS